MPLLSSAPARWLEDRRALEPTWELTLSDWVTVVSPSPDGLTTALGSGAGEAVVVDSITGAPVAALSPHGAATTQAAWSPDGAVLATAGQDGAVRLWRRDQDWQQVGELHEDGWPGDLCWNREMLLAVAIGKTTLVADARGKTLARYGDASSTVTALDWSGDGRRLAAASYGGIRWYEPTRNTTSAHRCFAWKGSVLAVAIGPGDRWMVGGGQDATIHVWRLWSGTDYEMSGFGGKVSHLSWHHGGRWLMAGCRGMLTRWDFSGKGPAGRRAEVFETNDTRLGALSYQPGGDLVATAHQDGSEGAVVVWKPGRSRRPAYGWPLGEVCGGMAWLSSGDALVIGGSSGHVGRVEVVDVR